MANDANIIKIKRSGTSGAPSSLKLGELAYSYLTASGNPTSNGGDRLFIGANGVNGSGNANDIIVIGGKYFTDLLDHTRGTLTASSALIVDSDKKLDELLVDDLSLNGNILSVSGNNNLKLQAGSTNIIELASGNYIAGGIYTGSQLILDSGISSLKQLRDGDVSLVVGTANSATSTVTLNNDGSLTVPGTIKTLSNGDLTLSPNGTGLVTIDGTYGLVLPVGTSLNRGTGVQGEIRYNTTITGFEGYNGTDWSSLGGVRSVDGNAYIIAETSPGAGDDTLHFYAGTSGSPGTSVSVADWSTTTLTVKTALTATTANKDINLGASAGTGTTTINSGALGSLDNIAIGGTTAAAGKFTSVTDTGLTSTRVTFAGTGGLLSDSANLTYASGVFTIADNTASTSTTTGALVVTGGVGITGDLQVGGLINAASATFTSINNTPIGNTTRSTGAFSDLYTDDVGATQVVYGGTDGLLTGTSTFTFTAGTGKLAVPTEIDVGNLVLSGSSVSSTSTSGAVNINTSPDGTTNYHWQFNTDGTFTLPGTILVPASDSGSISFGNTGTEYGYIKVDNGHNMVVNQTGNYYVKQNGSDRLAITDTTSNLSASTDVTIQSNKSASAYTWSFNADGTTQFPNYKFTADAPSNGQALIYNSGTGLVSWTTVSQTVYIGTTAFTTGNASGSNTIIAGLTEVDVGSLVLSGNTVSTSADTGDVNIIANTGNGDKTFTFDGDGGITLPQGGFISEDSNAYDGSIKLKPSGGSTATQALVIYPTGVDGDHIHLTADGGTTDLYLGSDSQFVKVDHSGTIAIGTNGSSTLRQWTFGTDGTTTFPNYTFPAAASSTAGYVLTDVVGNGTLSWASPSLSIAGSTGTDTVTLVGDTLTFAGATTPITVAVTNNTVTVAVADATASAKGLASFNTSGFVVTSGDVALKGDVAQSISGDSGSATPSTNSVYIVGTSAQGISTSGTANTLTITASDATSSQKGVASFNTASFAVTSGDVTIKSAGVSNAQLANSKVTIGTTDISLGSSSTTLAGLTEIDVGSLVLSSNTIATTGSTGAVTIESNDGTTNHTWTFGTNGNLDVAGKITGVATPTDATDAANKAYVDAARSGLDVKASVRATTTGNITLSNTQTVDGVALAVGDRVLVKNQDTASENGIYVVASGAWTRAEDADNTPAGEVTSGMFTFVEQGSLYADSGWVLTTDGVITLDTTSLTFVQFSGAGQITAGDGLSKTGNRLDVNVANGIEISGDNVQLASTVAGDGLTYTSGVLDVVGTANRISVTANAVDIASTYVGQNTITTLGTISTGTWQGTVVAETYGGTGQSAYAKGDLLYASGTNTLSKLTAGTNGQTLQLQGGVPVWADLDGGTY
jgi:hypothetical protein